MSGFGAGNDQNEEWEDRENDQQDQQDQQDHHEPLHGMSGGLGQWSNDWQRMWHEPPKYAVSGDLTTEQYADADTQKLSPLLPYPPVRVPEWFNRASDLSHDLSNAPNSSNEHPNDRLSGQSDQSKPSDRLVPPPGLQSLPAPPAPPVPPDPVGLWGGMGGGIGGRGGGRRPTATGGPSYHGKDHGGDAFPGRPSHYRQPGQPGSLGTTDEDGLRVLPVPVPQFAVSLSAREMVAGGEFGEQLRRLRQEEETMVHTAQIAYPDLGSADPVPVSSLMTLPIRHRAGRNGWRETRGVTPRLIPQMLPYHLTALLPVPGLEELHFQPNVLACHARNSLNSLDRGDESAPAGHATHPSWHALNARMILPSSVPQGGFSFYVERSPLLRLLVALAFCRLYKRVELVSFALNVHPDGFGELYDMPREYGAWFGRGVATGTYFAPSDQAAQLWTTFHARYYTKLWRLVSVVLCPHRTLDAQTAEYLGTPYVPALGPERRRAITRWTSQQYGAEVREEVAWSFYRHYLAERNVVPQALIDSRLDSNGGDWPIRSFREYVLLVSKLYESLPDLMDIRDAIAPRFRREGREMLLWLMEPLRWVPKT